MRGAGKRGHPLAGPTRYRFPRFPHVARVTSGGVDGEDEERWRGRVALRVSSVTRIICGIIKRLRRRQRRQWVATGGCRSDSNVTLQ